MIDEMFLDSFVHPIIKYYISLRFSFSYGLFFLCLFIEYRQGQSMLESVILKAVVEIAHLGAYVVSDHR